MFRKILLLDLLFLLILISPASYGQLMVVNGYILNSNSGEKIKNVSVFEKNSQTGTISNEDGYFQLVLQSGEINLSFSDNAYFPEITELKLVSDTLIKVQMNLLKLPKNNIQKQDSTLAKQTASIGIFKHLRKKNSIH